MSVTVSDARSISNVPLLIFFPSTLNSPEARGTVPVCEPVTFLAVHVNVLTFVSTWNFSVAVSRKEERLTVSAINTVGFRMWDNFIVICIFYKGLMMQQRCWI